MVKGCYTICMPVIELQNVEIPYTIIRSRRNSISASILADGSLAVKAPQLIPEFILRQFLKSKSDWIISHVTRRRKMGHHDLLPSAKSGDPEKVHFFEKQMAIVITETSQATKGRLFKVNDTFQIILPTGLTPAKREKQVHKLLHDWYKQNSMDELLRRVRHYAGIIGVTFGDVRIKDVTGHWGSCSVDHNLNFNYRLGMLPVQIADYVIVHELCHILQMNHSSKFWDEVEKYCPNYKALRKELKTYHFL